jgi:hypothetical protein
MYILFFCLAKKVEKFGLKGFMKNFQKKKNRYALTTISKEMDKMMQKSTAFTTIFRVKKYYLHYDFACKKVPLSLRYAKNNIFGLSHGEDRLTAIVDGTVVSPEVSVHFQSCLF